MKIIAGFWETLICCGLAAVIAVSSGCAKKEVKKMGERKTRVRLANIEKRTLKRSVPVQGTVMPVEFATISAKISGTLELLKVDEGDVVKADTVLFSIDQKVLKNQVTVREGEIKVCEAVLNSAEVSFAKALSDNKRAERLFKSKSISEADFEHYGTELKKAEAAVANAKAQLEQAKTNLTIAKKNLEDSTITAPFDCVVTGRFVEEQEYVTAGKNILKLENQKQLEVVAYISSVYYNDIVVGKTMAEFFLDGKEIGKGVVTFRAPSVDDVSRTFKVKMLVPAGVDLISGTLCDINLVLENREVYALPTDSLLLRAKDKNGNDRYIVYAIDEKSRAKSFDVRKGIVDGSYCEVIGAEKLLKEKIVVAGQTFVNNGSLLEVVTDK